MLKPSNKKKKKSNKRDVLGQNQRYEPLEIDEENDEDGGSISPSSPHPSSQRSFMTRWKGAFFVSTIVLLPLLVYYIFDKSGLVIVIDKKRPDADDSEDENVESQPIISGIQEPNHQRSHSMGNGNHKNKKGNARQHPIKGNHHNHAGARNKPVMSTKKKVNASSKHNAAADTHDETEVLSLPYWPSSNLECALDLTIDFEDSMTKLRQPGVSFCRESATTSSTRECHCESTIEPAPQSPEKVSRQDWDAAMELNKQLVQSAPNDLDVVLLGDSITEHLNGNELGQSEESWEEHSAVFEKLFSRDAGGDINGMALGIGGDGSAQLLYRLRNGEVPPDPAAFDPKVWWVLIGTLDLSESCSADATLMGILAVVQEIRQLRPMATIAINSILPRPRNDMGTLAGILWTKSEWINQRLECFASGLPRVEYFNATSIFLGPEGDKLKASHFAYDWIHPSAMGTEEWGEAIVEKVKALTCGS